MNNEFWKNRYAELKEKGVVGSMSYGDQFQDRVNTFFEKIKNVLAIDKCGSIVDFGCGTAKYAKLLTNHFNAKKYTGIDIIDFVIEDNKKKLPDYEFIVYDETMPRANVYFIASLFQHMSDAEIKSVLRKMKTSLIRGGKIFIVDYVGSGEPNDYTYYRDIEQHNIIISDVNLESNVVYNEDNMAVFECIKSAS